VRFRGLIVATSLATAGAFAGIAVQTAFVQTARAGTDDVAAGDAAWRILLDTGTADQLRRFIAEAPDGPRRHAAEERLKALPAIKAEPVQEASNPSPKPVRTVPIAPDAGIGKPLSDVSSNPQPSREPASPATPSGVQDALNPPPDPPADAPPNPAPLPSWDWNAPQPSQKVMVYEESKTNSNGVQFTGTAVWRIEPAPSAAAAQSGVAIRVDLDIPTRNMAVRLTIRRNEDKTLPASHTVNIRFWLSPNFPHAGISNIPGILMKQDETVRGTALNGIAVKVQDDFFLVGLTSRQGDMQQNVLLLKERQWFDIPVVYGDGQRALIAIEKGKAGDRVFAEAFAAWEREAGP
jgi:hypothetical protein